MRVQAAEIVERARRGERVGIRVIRVERFRPEDLVGLDHGMGNVVVVDEFDRRSHRGSTNHQAQFRRLHRSFPTLQILQRVRNADE